MDFIFDIIKDARDRKLRIAAYVHTPSTNSHIVFGGNFLNLTRCLDYLFKRSDLITSALDRSEVMGWLNEKNQLVAHLDKKKGRLVIWFRNAVIDLPTSWIDLIRYL